MGLLEEFQQSNMTAQRGTPCSFVALRAALTPKERAELDELLALPPSKVEHTALARFISKKWPEHAMKDGTVSRHRRGECSC